MPTLIEHGIRVDLEGIGEGWDGDYDAADPEDEPLLRFDVYIHADVLRSDPNLHYMVWGGYSGLDAERLANLDEWTPVEDASYCTAFPETAPMDQQEQAVRFLMERIKPVLLSGGSYKRLCEELSWISPKSLVPIGAE